MVSKSVFQFSSPTSLPERKEYEFAFRFWCCEPSVKKQCGREIRGLILFIIIVDVSALIFNGWVVVAWGREFCLGLAEISSLCSWYNSRMGHTV